MRFSVKDRFGFLIYFLSILKKEVSVNRKAEKLGYYTSIDDIPIYNWDKIEQGKYEYLFKNKKGVVPRFFNDIISDMFFQFEQINMDMIEKRHKLAYLKSLYATTRKVKFLNQSNHLAAEIKKLEEKKIKKVSLNEKTNYIESVLNSIGSIDVKKMSASRFYSLFHLAIKKAENKRRNGINK